MHARQQNRTFATYIFHVIVKTNQCQFSMGLTLIHHKMTLQNVLNLAVEPPLHLSFEHYF